MSMMDEKKEALNEIHKSLERKAKQICSKNEDIILENRLFAVLCGNFELEPTNLVDEGNRRMF